MSSPAACSTTEARVDDGPSRLDRRCIRPHHLSRVIVLRLRSGVGWPAASPLTAISRRSDCLRNCRRGNLEALASVRESCAVDGIRGAQAAAETGAAMNDDSEREWRWREIEKRARRYAYARLSAGLLGKLQGEVKAEPGATCASPRGSADDDWRCLSSQYAEGREPKKCFTAKVALAVADVL